MKLARHALLIASIIALSILLGCWLKLSAEREQEYQEQTLQFEQLTRQLARYNARSLEAVDILLQELATDLPKRENWQTWTTETGAAYLFYHRDKPLPQLRSLIVFDERGNFRFSSPVPPLSTINVSDRPYFRSLEQGANFAMSGPYVGRSTGLYTYTLARRLDNPQQSFQGVVHASFEPGHFQDFCWPLRITDEFDAVLVNQRGEIVASCRPTDLSARSPLLGAKFSQVLADGKLANLPVPEQTSKHGGWVSTRSSVEGFPNLQVVAIVPEDALLQKWNRRFTMIFFLAGLAVCALLAGGWLISRKARRLEKMRIEFLSMRTKLEQELQESAIRLEQQRLDAVRASAAKNRFLAAASHDLRQPLHALALFASDLHRQIRLNNTEQLHYLAHQIQSSTEALRELLDSLLDISRLDVSGITPQLSCFPIKTLFDRLATSFDRAALAKGLQLRFRAHGLSAYSDITLLERLLANLVSNAIRYTEKGSILVSARRQGEQILLEVRDTGIGIAPEHHHAIFTEFYQVDNAARESHKGLGLGLSIVDRLATALDTKVELKSWVGKGTRFSIKIPSAHVVDKPAVIPPAPGAGTIIGILGSATVLLEALELIQSWGYTVHHPPRESHPPNIIVTCAADASSVLLQYPNIPILALGSRDIELPSPIHLLHLPIRPARLRALLRRLEA